MTEEVVYDFRPNERRRGKPKRNTINQILDSMQDHADNEFNGNVPDNLLILFNALPIDDKRTFLRRSMEALWDRQIELAEKGLSEVVLQRDITDKVQGEQASEVRINPAEVISERDLINTASPDEQRKLRGWLVKAIIFMMLVMFIVVIFFTSLYGENDIQTIFEGAKSLSTLVDMLFKDMK